jgi:hypothetical protein
MIGQVKRPLGPSAILDLTFAHHNEGKAVRLNQRDNGEE